MQRYALLLFLTLASITTIWSQDKTSTIADKTKNSKAYAGYFNFYWDEKEGKIWLEIDKWDQEILYVNGLSAGVGSNDIGLDRNQLGSDRIVRFVRIGPKVLMMQPNYDYRAVSNNPDEARSVAEAFASSTLWGFKVEAEENGKALVDFTPFLLRDAHGVANRLRTSRQGSYNVDATRSAIFMERTKNFPKNSEFEAIITFSGDPQGEWIRSVTPSPDAVTVRMHHSLIELPDANYQPRVYDPRAGYFATAYRDYATPIEQPLVKRFITRHRLEKKDPKASMSDPVEPIIYYLDRGAPEPIKSALIEGGRWWNQAFEAAGYRNAFRVEVLPEGADPMDVRYNLINWVHRSTRGWSYGSSVSDPRTGEIIKGHVLLGSLRVRQDFLIAQGMIEAYENGTNPDPRLKELALARLRQLSAHEIGHTLGLAHNFAASVKERASVMDYPHPFIALDDKGKIDFSKAYAVGIGDWDKRSILYGYQDFPDGTDEAAGLKKILDDNIKMGFQYITDEDSRAPGGAHPYSHLWDGGKSATEELRRIMAVRQKALNGFSEKNIPVGSPMSTLESVLVPVYLAHRYQVEAAVKLVGGVNYTYAVRGDGQPTNQMIDDAVQRDALNGLIATLDPQFLAIPERVIALIPPQASGYRRDRELFKVYTGLTFDPIAAAESSVEHTLDFLLHPQRLARLVEHGARDGKRLDINDVFDMLFASVQKDPGANVYWQELNRVVEKSLLNHLLNLAGDKEINQQVAAHALLSVRNLEETLPSRVASDAHQQAHYEYLREQIKAFRGNPDAFKVPAGPVMPDGAPIGCDWE